MAIPLIALQGNQPQIDTVGAFQQGEANALNANASRMAQEKAALEQWAQIGLGVMDGNPDGQINPDRLNQIIAMKPDDPIAQHLKANPELLRTITRGSLEVLKYGQDEARFEEAKRQFELNLANDTKRLSLAEQAAQAGGNGETFAMQPTYYNVTDPQTGKQSVKFGQLGNRGTFKEVALPEGASPAIPVQQLNTGTDFVPVDKFGGRPADAAPTPINNTQAEYDKTVGKASGELDVAKPALKRKAESGLKALERQNGIVTADIDKAVSAINSNPGLLTGLGGDLTKVIPGSQAYDLAQTLLTLQANIGFDALQQMRESSPTGGALGAISDKENALLQAVRGATAQGQSAAQLVSNLNRIKGLASEVLADRKAAFNADFGGVGNSDAMGAPARPTTEEEYNALPSGSVFIDPEDGKQYRKP